MRISFFPDYSETESLIILKAHHSVTDGVTAMCLTSTLQDNGYQKADFPNLIPRANFVQNLAMTVMKYVTLPYSILVA